MSYDNSAHDPAGGTGQNPPESGSPPPFQGQLPPYPGPPAHSGQPFADGFRGYGMPPAGPPPPSYLTWAITAAVGGVLFSLILGFPCALVATRYARRVRPAWDIGNQQEAMRSSRLALTWAIAATVLDMLGVALFAYIVSRSGTTPIP